MFVRIGTFALSLMACACAATAKPSSTPAEDVRTLTCASAPPVAVAPRADPQAANPHGPLPWGAPIRKLVVEAPPDVPPALIREVVRSEVGGPLDEPTVRQDVRRLYALSIFEDVEVHANLELEGLTLVYRLAPHPLIRQGFVSGDAGAVLDARHRPRAGEIFDPRELAARRALLSAELNVAGFRHASVEHRMHTAPDGALSVCLNVKRGPRFSISEIAFDGLRSVSRRDLLASMDTRGDRVNTVGRPVHPDLFENDRLRMHALFYDRGFINAEIDEPRIRENARTGEVRIEFAIREGEPFDVGELRFVGGLLAPVEVYADLVGLTPGDRFSRKRVLDGIEKIRELHTSMGRPPPEVVPETELHAAARTIDLVLRVGGD